MLYYPPDDVKPGTSTDPEGGYPGHIQAGCICQRCSFPGCPGGANAFPVKAIQVDSGSGCDQESGNRRQLPDEKTYLKAYEGHLAARDFRP